VIPESPSQLQTAVLLAPPALDSSVEVTEVLGASYAPASLLVGLVDLAPSATSAAALASAVLASRKSDPAVGDRLIRPHLAETTTELPSSPPGNSIVELLETT
jgi:hypothetical protein